MVWVYALGTAALVAQALAALVALRLVERWPFEALHDAAAEPISQRAWARAVAAAAAGAGTGAFAGLTHPLEAGALHVGTAIAYFFFLPAALPSLLGGVATYLRRLAHVTLCMVGVECGAQVGVYVTKGRLLWDEVTLIDLGFWLGGSFAAALWGLPAVARRG